jgi:amino acid adenylation domain-containing protein
MQDRSTAPRRSPHHGLSAAKQALLEQRLRGLKVGAPADEAPSRRPAGAAPLSFAQQRLWFLYQLDSATAAYNIPAALRLTGDLDPERLERCLDEIVRRHEVLRTAFAVVDAQPVQVILPEARLRIGRRDLSQWPVAEREAEVLRLAREEGQRPFDLGEAPLLRASLLDLGETDGRHRYVLLFAVHHIVSDGWSSGILFREFTALYRAFSQGQPSPLPEPALQYADFAHWQRRWLQGDRQARQLAFWVEQLRGAPACLDLPTDRPRPPVQGSEGETYTFALSKALAERLNRLSRQVGVTAFVTLFAAFGAFLHRYSGQDDFCLGVPVAGRTHPEWENLIGFFVNTLVFRTRYAGNPRFLDLLRRVQEFSLGAHAHQELPFEQLVEALQPARNLSYNPLFQVMLVLHNLPFHPVDIPNLAVESLEVDFGIAKFDLIFHLTEHENGFEAAFEYATDLFDRARMVRMAEEFKTLLEAAVERPETRIGQLPLLPEAEFRRVVADWNRTERAYPEPRDLVTRFETQAQATPDAVAVAGPDGRLSYRELAARVGRVAHGLAARGIGPERLVALLHERGGGFLVMMLGVFRAGGAYLPLDPAHPDGRSAQVLAESRVGFLLCGAAYRARAEGLCQGLPAPAPQVLVLEDLEREPAEGAALPSRHGQDNLAVVIFTSGSTGKPKGAMVEHRGMYNNLITKVPTLELTAADVIAQTAGQCFDISVWQFLTALVLGARVEVFEDAVVREPAELARGLAERGVTVLEAVPALIGALLDLGGTDLPALRWLIACGEAFPPDLCRRWLARFPHTRVLNAYGPAECSDDVSYYAVPEPPGETATVVPVGRPVDNTRLYLLDRGLEPVPVGVPGEICVAGIQVGRGYLHRPELTAAAFVPDPFAPPETAGSSRLYRTGDLGRYRPDGDIEFLGRIDHQVKVRGFRVEPGEIEARLLEHPEVARAVVLARDDGRGGKRLVAYVAPPEPPESGDEAERAERLRAHLRGDLPDYMIPSAFVFLERLPLSANGKIDRKALPEPDAAGTADHRYVAPATPVEEVLAGLWREVLGLQRVGVHDDFFELGGHSLLAMQLIARIQQTFAVPLPVAELFQAPTIAGLVPLLIGRESAPGYVEAVARVQRRLAGMSEDEMRALIARKHSQKQEQTDVLR